MKIARIIEAERENEVNVKVRNRKYSLLIIAGTILYLSYEIGKRSLI